ncbi:MAG: MetQ/NlpA family ABC transporter substrate-binding protein [Actinomycetota bacterium]|nr:MetQ/NlpA family ABC transporter substrate-binding protein [Actinomycetota bacterium]
MRIRRLLLAVLVAMLLAGMATGCTNKAADSSGAGSGEVEFQPVRIGTLPTEDALPLWVAEDQGLFTEAGLLSVSIVTFQSAQERDAALLAGEIDAFMGDIIAAAQLEAGGTPVTIATVMLGATPAEGRFGIVAAPESGFNELSALAGVPVGTSSSTIQEYVLDGLMRQAGVSDDKVVVEEVKKVPVRFELLMKGQLKAAALPEPLLTLAEAQGAKLLADDSAGENLSQTVLVFTDEYLAATGGIETMTALLEVWDDGARLVNAKPDSWRTMLVDKARLPEPIKDSYKISTYPTHDVPSKEQIDAVLGWMGDKQLLKETVTYENLVLVMP